MIFFAVNICAPKLGRWLGVAENYGASMCFFALAQNGKVLARSTVQHVARLEEAQSEISARMKKYDVEIGARLDDTNHMNEPTRDGDILLEDDNFPVTPVENSQIPEEDDAWQSSDAFDGMVGANVMLPRGDGRVEATVLKRKRDNDGKAIGRKHQNPMMDD